VATTSTEDGHRQNTKTSTAIQTERKKEHRVTEEEMEETNVIWRSKEQANTPKSSEHDDDISCITPTYLRLYVCHTIQSIYCKLSCRDPTEKQFIFNAKFSFPISVTTHQMHLQFKVK
jgi:hypothetical protein